MDGLRAPWLELGILIPAAGAVWVGFARDANAARRTSLYASGLAMACALAAWWGFAPQAPPDDRGGLLLLDELSAPKLPLAALLYFLTNLATLRTKAREFSFARSLGSEAILLATFACNRPWGVATLLAVGVVPPYLELRQRNKPQRVYAVYMGVFVALLLLGQVLADFGAGSRPLATAGAGLLAAAVLLRSGAAPLHFWATDLFEHATFGTALLFVGPMPGAYGAMRLVLPVAPPWILHAASLAALLAAVYAAGMALVQHEARRFFCYLFLSQSSLILVGLEAASPLGVAGALCVWLSTSLALTGFGLTLRCVESRVGRISLAGFQGLHRHVPTLAGLFLVTGLASIGFPGTVGFIGLELLVEGTAQASPLVGAAVVTVAALNGLAMLHAYFRIFTGRPRAGSIDLRIRPAEQASVLVLAVLILGGALFPQPGVAGRYHAAVELSRSRARRLGESSPASHGGLTMDPPPSTAPAPK